MPYMVMAHLLDAVLPIQFKLRVLPVAIVIVRVCPIQKNSGGFRRSSILATVPKRARAATAVGTACKSPDTCFERKAPGLLEEPVALACMSAPHANRRRTGARCPNHPNGRT